MKANLWIILFSLIVLFLGVPRLQLMAEATESEIAAELKAAAQSLEPDAAISAHKPSSENILPPSDIWAPSQDNGATSISSGSPPVIPGQAPVKETLLMPLPGTVVMYFSDFEINNGGMTGSVDWVCDVYNWVGDTCDGGSPPLSAHSGTRMWGTRLNTCYQNLGNNTGYDTCVNSNSGDDSILSFRVDLTGLTSAQLQWWEWYDLFSPWDWAEVRVNGTSVFTHCEPAYLAPTAWVSQNVDLTPFVGGPAIIEFHMMASTVVNRAGWFIDDVTVTGTSSTVLIHQEPNKENGIFADSDCDKCATSKQSIADDFMIPRPMKVNQITFWGGYFPDNIPLAVDDFTVILHKDDAGLPGTVVYSQNGIIPAVRTDTCVNIFGVYEYKYILNLPSAPVLPAGIYWVEIFNNTIDNTDSFFWETGMLSPTNGIAGSVWSTEVPAGIWNKDSYTNLSMQINGVPSCVMPWVPLLLLGE